MVQKTGLADDVSEDVKAPYQKRINDVIFIIDLVAGDILLYLITKYNKCQAELVIATSQLMENVTIVNLISVSLKHLVV